MKISKKGIKRLKKLAHFLETVHPSKFNLGVWVRGTNPQKMSEEPTKEGTCGTVACAVGWLPKLFPQSWKWDNVLGVVKMKKNTLQSQDALGASAKFFGISVTEAENLFLSHNYRYTNAKPRTVARRILHLVEKAG